MIPTTLKKLTILHKRIRQSRLACACALLEAPESLASVVVALGVDWLILAES